jgi:hypothetical protein
MNMLTYFQIKVAAARYHQSMERVTYLCDVVHKPNGATAHQMGNPLHRPNNNVGPT